MDKLPFELLLKISDHVVALERQSASTSRSCSSLSQYAVISRAWQSAIERRTFHDISLTSEQIVSGEAEKLLDNRRLDWLTSVKVQLMPTTADASPATKEQQKLTDEQQNIENIESQLQVLDLLQSHIRKSTDTAVVPGIPQFLLDTLLLLGRVPLRLEPHISFSVNLWCPRPDSQNINSVLPYATATALSELLAIDSVTFDIVLTTTGLLPSASCWLMARMSRLRNATLSIFAPEKQTQQLQDKLRNGTPQSLRVPSFRG